MEEPKYIEVEDQSAAIIMIPNNAVKLTITANVIDENDEIHEAEYVMKLPDIVEARIVGKEWEDENVKYVLTDKALAALAELGE